MPKISKMKPPVDVEFSAKFPEPKPLQMHVIRFMIHRAAQDLSHPIMSLREKKMPEHADRLQTIREELEKEVASLPVQDPAESREKELAE
jgi:hypothetical protein